jgi:hypothetical protein
VKENEISAIEKTKICMHDEKGIDIYFIQPSKNFLKKGQKKTCEKHFLKLQFYS